ncbi:Putative transmembrane protein [Chromobacterium vaccinii]|nr:Putative transmembrane protein [Chromobacterium vaccinii]QND92020.1 Putative transmembrane protein [Chromobacterium vaccinii]
MTPQETQALQNFLNQLVQVRGMAKDPQANATIMQAAAQQPDAVYLLVLRCMQQDQALNAANAQIAKLQSDLQAARSAPVPAGAPGTFLDPNAGSAAWSSAPAAPAFAAPRQAAPAAAYQQPAPAYQAAPPAYPPAAPAYQQAAPVYQQPAPAPRQGFFGGGSAGGFTSGVGSFLGNVATTAAGVAAGVAAGTFLVQGIESLFSDDKPNHESGQGHAGYEAEQPVEQHITINNYYESDGQDDAGYREDALPRDDYQTVADSDYASDEYSEDDNASA